MSPCAAAWPGQRACGCAGAVDRVSTRRAWEAALEVGRWAGATSVSGHVPQRLATQLLTEAGVPVDRRASDLRRGERIALIERLDLVRRCRGPATKGSRRPRSPAVASRWTKSTQGRSKAAVIPASFSAARCSTRSAPSVVTTSRGHGRRAAWPDRAPQCPPNRARSLDLACLPSCRWALERPSARSPATASSRVTTADGRKVDYTVFRGPSRRTPDLTRVHSARTVVPDCTRRRECGSAPRGREARTGGPSRRTRRPLS